MGGSVRGVKAGDSEFGDALTREPAQAEGPRSGT